MPENYYKHFYANILCAFLLQRMMLVFRCKKKKRRNERGLCMKVLYKQHENMSHMRRNYEPELKSKLYPYTN
jgi:hypothetical protein